MASKSAAAKSDAGNLLVNVSGIPSGVDKEDIAYYFSKSKCGGGEVTVIKFDDNEALVSIKHLDSQGKPLN